MKVTLLDIVEKIRSITHADTAELQRSVGELVEMIDDNISLTPGDRAYEILRELAYDLQFFEPDGRLRREDPAFFGIGAAIARLNLAVVALEPLVGSDG